MKSQSHNNFKFNIISLICLNLIVNILNLGVINLSATPQTPTTNSLETPLEDPLIPPSNIQRDLSALEIKRIKREIAKINRQATTELNSGDLELAFQLWFREIKLQRALSKKSEIIALGRIGNIAWEQNRGIELREIAQRLITIEEKAVAEDNFNNEFLNTIGLAYQQVKYLDRAVNIYQILLQKARQQNDLVAQKTNLEQLGELYLARFDYFSAAASYEELLTWVRNNSAIKNNEQILEPYLINLVEIYHYLKKPESAIKNQKQLIDIYLIEGKISSVAKLKIAVGNNYQNLQKSQLASQYYQEAYTLAQSLRQPALAADALTQLAMLYQENNQLELAIAVYLQLIDLEQKTNNFYGLINAYDNLGNLYLEVESYSQALDSFKAGLALAESFDYRTDYFVNKIQQLQ